MPMSPKIKKSVLPWYAINENNPNDQFYTKKEIAQSCYKLFTDIARQHQYDLKNHIWMDPAAGGGAFYNLLPPKARLGLDIDPHNQEISQGDFLTWDARQPGQKYAVITNPPFGVRGALALAFINRCACFAEIAGFILPMTFASDGKGSGMTRVKGYQLLHSVELPSNAFFDPQTQQEKSINTVFQIWAQRPDAARAPRAPAPWEDFIKIRTVCTAPTRRCGLDQLDEYDFFIQGTFYKNRPPHIVYSFDDVKYGSGYGILVKKDKAAVEQAFKKVNWLDYSSRATNHCYHIRMTHIKAALMAGLGLPAAG